MTCKFTKIIHDKNWTIKDACKHWGIRYDVWRRKCRNIKLEAQLLSMCNGLDDKRVTYGDIMQEIGLTEWFEEAGNGR